jgi:hypothetical protein
MVRTIYCSVDEAIFILMEGENSAQYSDTNKCLKCSFERSILMLPPQAELHKPSMSEPDAVEDVYIF